MNFYIMSRGRAGKITTLQWLPKSMAKRIKIVCGYTEYADYAAAYRAESVISAPSTITNYSEKFQWIMDDGMDDGFYKCAILDDDLVFSRRSSENSKSLITVREPELIASGWMMMGTLLDSVPLVGVHPRQMGQNTLPPFTQNGRIICIQGINRRKCYGIKVDQFPILADVVLNCTLLARGEPNAIITTFFQDHGPCQAPGGCSIYRTPQMQRDAVTYLAQRFPGFVRVVERHPKVAKWMGDTRWDYTAQWKKLYAAGVDYARGRGPSPDMETLAGNPAHDD